MEAVDQIIDELYEVAATSNEIINFTPDYYKNLDELMSILTKLIKIDKITKPSNIVKIFKIICYIETFSIQTKKFFLENILIPKNPEIIQSCIVTLFKIFLKVLLFNPNDMFVNGADSDDDMEIDHVVGDYYDDEEEEEEDNDDDDAFEDTRYALSNHLKDKKLHSKNLQNEVLAWFINTFPLWKDCTLKEENKEFFTDLYSKFFYMINDQHLRVNIISLLVLLTTRTDCKPFRLKILNHHYTKTKDHKFMVLYKLYVILLPKDIPGNIVAVTCNKRIGNVCLKKTNEILKFLSSNYSILNDSQVCQKYDICINHGNLSLLIEQNHSKSNTKSTRSKQYDNQQIISQIHIQKAATLTDFINYYPKLDIQLKDVFQQKDVSDLSLLYLALNPSDEMRNELLEILDTQIISGEKDNWRLHLSIHLLETFFHPFHLQTLGVPLEPIENFLIPYETPMRNLSSLLEIPTMDIESIYICITTITKTLLRNPAQLSESLHFIDFFKKKLSTILHNCPNIQYNRFLSLSFVNIFQLILKFDEEEITNEICALLFDEPEVFFTLIVKLNDPLVLNYICKIIVKYKQHVEESSSDEDAVDNLNEIVVSLTNYLWRNTNNMYEMGVFMIKGPFISKVIQNLYIYNPYQIKMKDFSTISGVSTLQHCFHLKFMELLNNYGLSEFPFPLTDSGYLKFTIILQQDNTSSLLLNDFPDFDSVKIYILQHYPYAGIKEFLFTNLKSLAIYAQA